MSVTTVGRLVPLEFHEYAKQQGLSLEYGQQIQDTRVLDVIIVHEENEPLRTTSIAKSDPNYEEKYNKLAEAGIWDLQRKHDDSVNFVFTEKSRKPKAFVCRYRGPYKMLREYIYGVQEENSETGTLVYASSPHLRTWCYGMENPGGGPAFVETDLTKVKAAVEARRKFSEIVETDWDTMRGMR